MSERSQEAERLIKKAEKEKSRWFVSEEQKANNAADYLEQAGNIYKSQKMYKQAAECFVRCAALKVKVGRGYDAAGLFKNAGIQLKLAGDPTSMQMLNRSVDLFAELGKGTQAAKMSKELGEQCERNQEFDDACVHFERAADLYKGEGSDSHARQCMEKVATFYALVDPPNYSKAAQVFEEIGVEALSTRLGRFNARKHFFRSVLCYMASGDAIGARAKHNEFKETDFKFGGSREGKFTDLLIAALEAFDGSKFSEAYRDYVEISPLDPWHTSVLRQAQKILTGDDDEAPPPKPKAVAAGGGSGRKIPLAEFMGSAEAEKVPAAEPLPDADGAAEAAADPSASAANAAPAAAVDSEDDDDDDAAMFS